MLYLKKYYLLDVTKLSKLTNAEFSPRKLNGVFFEPADVSVPVDVNGSANKLRSKGSLLVLLLLAPFVWGEAA